MKLHVITPIVLMAFKVGSAFGAESNSRFEDNLLTIHSIDSVDTPGLYQDVVIQLTSQGELLLLNSVTGVKIPKKIIDNVELVVTESFPVQVFLNISGVFSSGCSKVGQISYRLEGNRFNLSVYFDNDSIHPPGTFGCVLNTPPFAITFPLPVYGLLASDYEYTVNGSFMGSFTLTMDNEF